MPQGTGVGLQCVRGAEYSLRSMEGTADAGRAALESSRCAMHPELPAVALCERCGDYHCAGCHKRIAGRALCEHCRALPGIDYLEETRQRYWGKRDGFVWYAG